MWLYMMTTVAFLQVQGMVMHLCRMYPIHRRHGFLPKSLRDELISLSWAHNLLPENYVKYIICNVIKYNSLINLDYIDRLSSFFTTYYLPYKPLTT